MSKEGMDTTVMIIVGIAFIIFLVICHLECRRLKNG